MNVRVKLFAVARDIVGTEETVLSLPENSTTSSALHLLVQQHPKLEQWEKYLRVAVNWEYASSEQVLHNNDEIAVIPPVSGG